jgi:hypothetical protein
MAIVGGAAFVLGEYSFYGWEFLAYWPVTAGWSQTLVLLAALWATFLEFLMWRQLSRRARPLGSPRSIRWATAAAAGLVALALAYWLAHPQYQCLLARQSIVGMPLLAVVFGLHYPILRALREARRAGAALAATLVLEACLIFLVGELMAVDHYRKGLAHFQNEASAHWSISTAGATDFYFDYTRQEIVLRTRSIGGAPLDIRRSFGQFCR